ncbi:hypothetical protein COLO4_24647 [Corchorus olitorius]|uniref:Uncharacterized protein n=1 Tax=Corchorus olitorius TaxID=93759 RepID=A0A1R3I8H8_9ROSI|nr:hypothetical protein COLO4_24647 [Corchorus olitorius]
MNLHPKSLVAFAVASLFLGASASSSVAFLKASGINKLEVLMEVGATFTNGTVPQLI